MWNISVFPFKPSEVFVTSSLFLLSQTKVFSIGVLLKFRDWLMRVWRESYLNTTGRQDFWDLMFFGFSLSKCFYFVFVHFSYGCNFSFMCDVWGSERRSWTCRCYWPSCSNLNLCFVFFNSLLHAYIISSVLDFPFWRIKFV